MFGFVWFNPVMLLLTAYFEIHISNVIQTVSDLILEAKWPFSNKPKPFSVSGRVDHFIYTIYHCNIELYFLRSFHYCKPHNWFKVLCATWLLLFRPLHKSREKSCLTSSYCYLLLIRFRLFFLKVFSGNQAMGKFNKCINNLYLSSTRILFTHDGWKKTVRECFLMVNLAIRAALTGLCHWRHCGTADWLSVWASPWWQMCFQCCRDWNMSDRSELWGRGSLVSFCWYTFPSCRVPISGWKMIGFPLICYHWEE